MNIPIWHAMHFMYSCISRTWLFGWYSGTKKCDLYSNKYGKQETVDYHNIKTLKIKTYKTKQSVSLINGVVGGESKQVV